MERLTAKRVNGIKVGYWSPAKKDELVQRLGKYEDTGMEPEELRKSLKWIPVEERLPEGKTRVICQFDNGDIELLWQDWENDPETLTYWTDFDFMAEKVVVAWRPLPEPYHQER